jgi:hypothetical protein
MMTKYQHRVSSLVDDIVLESKEYMGSKERQNRTEHSTANQNRTEQNRTELHVKEF